MSQMVSSEQLGGSIFLEEQQWIHTFCKGFEEIPISQGRISKHLDIAKFGISHEIQVNDALGYM